MFLKKIAGVDDTMLEYLLQILFTHLKITTVKIIKWDFNRFLPVFWIFYWTFNDIFATITYLFRGE